MNGTWESALDTLEAQAAALAAFSDDPSGVPPSPADIRVDTPLPPHLAARAAAVQSALDAAAASLASSRDHVAAQLLTASHRADEAPTARYIDTST